MSMSIKIPYISIFGLIFARRTVILRLLFSVPVVFSQDAFAQSVLTDSETVDNEKMMVHQSEGEIPVREVELGPGPGDSIKLEQKYCTKIESQYEWHAHLLMESRYVTEGRDNSSGKRLLSVSTEVSTELVLHIFFKII